MARVTEDLSPESRKSASSYIQEEKQINPLRARYLSPYDHHSYSNPENESKGSLQLKELMHNINIMCMMENNYRKFFSSHKKEMTGTIVSRGLQKNDIILGKRGRPAKSSTKAPCVIPEKMMGSYLTSMQTTRDTLRSLRKSRIPKPRYRKKKRVKKLLRKLPKPAPAMPPKPKAQSSKLMSSSSQTKRTRRQQLMRLKARPREVRKKCPVYSNEMFMELLFLTQKQSNQTPIFYIKRNSVFEQIGTKLTCLKGKNQFSRRVGVLMSSGSYPGGPSEFNMLKFEKKMMRKGRRVRPRGDSHYNFGIFLKNAKDQSSEHMRHSRSKSQHESRRGKSEHSRNRRKRRKRQRAKRKESKMDARGRTSVSYCDQCDKDFGSFIKFLHHLQKVHQKNVEEVI